MNKILFLDFDGVLFDTVLESYLLARYAFYNINVTEKIEETDFKLFRSIRPFITDSWQYFYLMKIVEKSKIEKISSYYDYYCELIKNCNQTFVTKFDKVFQEKRKDLIENHYNFWNKLDKPFSFFEAIKTLNKYDNIIIVSTKNEEAILKHCLDYNFNISSGNIIGKTRLKIYGSKQVFISQYMIKNNISKAIFIDDSMETIIKCSKIPNLIALCAGWGYVKDKKYCYTEEEIMKLIKEEL